MDILITGADGFIASSLIYFFSNSDFLKEQNIKKVKIYATYHRTKPDYFESTKKNQNVSLFRLNVTDISQVIKITKKIKKIDLIVHCAALTKIKECEENQALAKKVNIEGTVNITKLAKHFKSRLIFLSTNAVFDGTKEKYSETTPVSPTTIYGKSKVLAEKEVLKFPKGIVIRFCPFGVHHYRKQKNFTSDILNALISKTAFTPFIDSFFNPISDKEFAKIISKIYKVDIKNYTSPLQRIFNIGSNESISRYDFSTLLAEKFGFEKKSFEKKSIESLNFNPPYPKNLTLDCKKIQETLNYKIPSIESMVKEFHKDYKEYKSSSIE